MEALKDKWVDERSDWESKILRSTKTESWSDTTFLTYLYLLYPLSYIHIHLYILDLRSRGKM